MLGKGLFPTELKDSLGDKLRTSGAEFGTTTGRPRRCGWLDLPALKLACRVAGIDALAVTKLDVLNGLDEVQACVGYDIDGEIRDEFPTDETDLLRAKPVFERFPGWPDLNTASANGIGGLPRNAQAFLKRIEAFTERPIALVSYGPNRAETAICAPTWAR